MWIYFRDGFVSIVRNTELPNFLHVRARAEAHLVAFRELAGLSPEECPLRHTPEGDYAWRCDIVETLVAHALFRQASSIDYDNFKGAVHDEHPAHRSMENHAWHKALMDTWSASRFFQEDVESDFLDTFTAALRSTDE